MATLPGAKCAYAHQICRTASLCTGSRMHAGDITLLEGLQTFRPNDVYKEAIVGDQSVVMLRLCSFLVRTSVLSLICDQFPTPDVIVAILLHQFAPNTRTYFPPTFNDNEDLSAAASTKSGLYTLIWS